LEYTAKGIEAIDAAEGASAIVNLFVASAEFKWGGIPQDAKKHLRWR
jgi:hypothetical protein